MHEIISTINNYFKNKILAYVYTFKFIITKLINKTVCIEELIENSLHNYIVIMTIIIVT